MRRRKGDKCIPSRRTTKWEMGACCMQVEFGVGLSFLFFDLALANHMMPARYPRNACRFLAGPAATNLTCPLFQCHSPASRQASSLQDRATIFRTLTGVQCTKFGVVLNSHTGKDGRHRIRHNTE